MTTGFSAAIVLTVGGTTASDVGQEQDLDTDAGGDLLGTDSSGNVLLAIPALLWTGGTASIVVADRAERLDAEGWIDIVTETGSPIETEGT